MYRYWTVGLLGLLLSLGSELVLASEPEAAMIELGTTDLIGEVGATVGYAVDGRPPLSLGFRWTGFDYDSGVWFVSEQAAGVMNQVFMHCPFRQGTGMAFADSAVERPRTKRVRLCFEIGIRPTAKNTDGVTYRVKTDGTTRFDRHCTWKEFRTFERDLTAYAGKRMSLRLEVDPGPNRQPRDDWSLWRNARILAGTDRELEESAARKKAFVARLRANAVRRGLKLATQSLLPLSSSASVSVCPSLLQPATNSMRKEGQTYMFRCEGDETIEYRFDPAKGLLNGLSVLVSGAELRPRQRNRVPARLSTNSAVRSVARGGRGGHEATHSACKGQSASDCL